MRYTNSHQHAILGDILIKKYKNYTDEDIINKVKEVKSLSALLKVLNLKSAGGNFANMKRNLQRLEVDTTHWRGQAWNKDEQFKNYSDYSRPVRIKPHLIKLRGHKCESCGLTEWLGLPIVLELHHINGDRTHNDAENLQLLCPNCHSITDNWRNRKR